MTDLIKNRYDIENLPISEETRKGLTTENIDYIGAIGRMLSLQDEVTQQIIEEAIAVQTKFMLAKINEQNRVINKMQRLLFDIQEEVKGHEVRIKDHEIRLKKLESRVDKIFLEHKDRVNHLLEEK